MATYPGESTHLDGRTVAMGKINLTLTLYNSMKTIILLLTLVSTLASARNIQVYIGTAKEGIYLSQLDLDTGKLTEAKQVAKISGTGFLVVHPDKKNLYTIQTGENTMGSVVAYSINPDGSLTEINRQGVKGNRLCHVSLDATSGVLMGANYREGNVVSFPLKKDGSIGKLASFHQHTGSSIHPKRQTNPHAHSIYSGPNNRYCYAPDLGIDKIMTYALVPATGKLTPVGFTKAPEGAGPRHMKFGKNLHDQSVQAYVLNELQLSISVFDQNPVSGKLMPKQVVSTLAEGAGKTKMSCSEIRVSPNGQFIYCANRDLSEQNRDSISVFSVGKGGKITRIQTIGAEVWIPRNINLDPTGKWLIVAGQKSNNVPVFKIDQATGKLSYTGNKVSAPKAMCIEFGK